MKVLFVSSGNVKGFQIAPFIKEQGESLRKQGIEVDFYSIIGKGIFGYIKAGMRLRKNLKNKQYDLIHAHFTLSGWAALIGARGIPVVLSLMGDDANGTYLGSKKISLGSRMFIFLTMLIQPFVKAIISKSINIEKKVYLKKKSYILPNGIDMEKFNPGINDYSSQPIKNGKKSVLFLGNRDNIGKNFPLAKNAIAHLGLSDVELISPYPVAHDNIPGLLNAAHVLVFPSFMEGSPNVIKEAMSCNCPIVATDTGDIKWVFGETEGCYIGSFDPVDFAEKVKYAIKFSESKGRTNGNVRIRELGLDAETIAKKLIGIYNTVITNHSRRDRRMAESMFNLKNLASKEIISNSKGMSHLNSKTRVLIFIGSLRSGGKERRLVELLTFLNSTGLFEILVVVTKDEVHYQQFFTLKLQYKVLKKKWKKYDPTIFYQFYKISKEFQPNVIHTWGHMQSLYTLPAVIIQRSPLINSQITGAPIILNRWSLKRIIDRIIFHYSHLIIANSKAGLRAYNPPKNKSKVIYNGISMSRFMNLPGVDVVKEKYGIVTPYAVIMTASFTFTKNYSLFFRIADKITKLRSDITFIGVGGYDKNDTEYKRMLEISKGNSKIIFPGKIDDVEALVNACTIGLLFSTNGEGISNSIMEYMALAKPVIANSAGGMTELVHHNINGYLIKDETEEEIKMLILDLINNPKKCKSFGECGKRIIQNSFSIEKMGSAFQQVYTEVPWIKERYSSPSFFALPGHNAAFSGLKEFKTFEKPFNIYDNGKS